MPNRIDLATQTHETLWTITNSRNVWWWTAGQLMERKQEHPHRLNIEGRPEIFGTILNEKRRNNGYAVCYPIFTEASLQPTWLTPSNSKELNAANVMIPGNIPCCNLELIIYLCSFKQASTRQCKKLFIYFPFTEVNQLLYIHKVIVGIVGCAIKQVHR